MVATRRQSGRVSAPVPEDAPDAKDVEDEESELSDLEDDASMAGSASESESDWESGAHRKVRGKASAKRAKVSSKSSPSKVQITKASRGRRSLSLLLTMPMDILFEIFGLLPPKDLVSLSRTSKPLRQTLMSRNAITVWKAARESAEGPDPPHDFSEPQWAVLLFAGTNCQVCGAKGILNIDFFIRRRVCIACKKKNLVVTSKFPRLYPDYDRAILDLIQYTNVGGWGHGIASKSKFYWQSDIDDMVKEWGVFQKSIHMRAPGAKQKLEEFREERIKAIQLIVQHAETCQKWYDNLSRKRLTDNQETSKKRAEAIFSRFREMGYLDADIQAIAYESQVSGGELTERGWVRIRPTLEPKIQERRDRRVAEERRRLVKDRVQFLKVLYTAHLKTLVPSQWLSYPTVEELADMVPVKQVIDAASDIIIHGESFKEVMVSLPTLVSAWNENRRALLTEKLAAVKPLPEVPPSHTDNLSVTASSSASPATSDILALATSVFQCGTAKCEVNNPQWTKCQDNPLFGWDGAISHHCMARDTTNSYFSFSLRLAPVVPSVIEVSSKGSALAADLVTLVKLDPTRATIATMDQRGDLFLCSECVPDKQHDGLYGRPVFTWRSAIAHATAHGQDKIISWHVLTPSEVANVKRSQDPVHRDYCWTCNHCTIHFDAWKTKATVLEHLVAVHKIVQPTEPSDLFFIPEKRRSRALLPIFIERPPQPSGRQPNLNASSKPFRCKRCPKSNRLFDIGGVQAHLRDKHKIASPMQGQDWDRVVD
ncbi:hypothetical protein Hypma_012173 [Hypsizygus marmoreus]|uniref:F-box domain-containing protein n=1 Tax=Hypsizygus marmoreus TaxID=39966 RepID=A0A369JPB2_HYPMA|nr:hypothetical protein Hypma_012173 [Hypsizygus marmoreus]